MASVCGGGGGAVSLDSCILIFL
eukprot:SAG31_NODE_17570_length_666_cov_1.044092_1_plen_22_part_10